MSNSEISERAIKFVKLNKKEIIDKFASNKIYKSFDKPVSFFMAGSPGAGKTEISKDFILETEKAMNKRLGNSVFGIVRIDADEIREYPLPGYSGRNSDLFQGAVSLGVNVLIDHCFDNKLNMLVDGTFSTKNSLDNVRRAIKHGRMVYIIYVHQEPLKAWELAKARELKEGRAIPPEVFVNSFFLAKRNVDEIKKIFGDKVNVDYIERDFEKKVIKYEINVNNIDSCLTLKYTKESLEKVIK